MANRKKITASIKQNKIFKDIQIERLKKPELRKEVISVRTTKRISDWMIENQISPSKLFNESAELIMDHHGSSNQTTL
ncbi:hypothetical protein HQ531_02755 [bacterium]|nr:hypothetical protein [bacterium]